MHLKRPRMLILHTGRSSCWLIAFWSHCTIAHLHLEFPTDHLFLEIHKVSIKSLKSENRACPINLGSLINSARSLQGFCLAKQGVLTREVFKRRSFYPLDFTVFLQQLKSRSFRKDCQGNRNIRKYRQYIECGGIAGHIGVKSLHLG